MIENTHLDLPLGGPTLWLARWEEIINKAEWYGENLLSWLRNICLVWEQVPNLSVYFSNIKLNIWKHTTAKYTPAEISSSMHFHWEHRKQRLTLKPVSKPKATQLAFATQKVTLNKEEVLHASDNLNATFDATETGATIAKKPKILSKKDKKQKIKMRIKAAITSTKVACITKTQITALALQDPIVQHINKNATFVPDAAVYHIISANAIFH